MDRGWSLKHLHRLIVTSATYRQSSRSTPELLARDPYNRLLARGPRFRVDAEIVRDIALAASGLLEPKVGGPSVFPPAPAFLFQPPASYGPKVWHEANGPDRYRRALYTFRYRSVPYPMLQIVRRAQRRLRLRPPDPLEHAAAGADDAERADLPGMRPGPGLADAPRGRRRPTPTGWTTPSAAACRASRPRPRAATLLDLLHRQIQTLREARRRTLGPGGRRPEASRRSCPTGATPAQLAAWTAVARVLLNLDETITKE